MTITFTTCYDTELSKNEWHGYASVRGYSLQEGRVVKKAKVRVYTNPGTKIAMERIFWEIKALGPIKWKEGKIRVDIYAYRPDFKFDVQNAVNPICDAVKLAIGIDDNVYATSTDYEMVPKGKERIQITITDEEG